MGKFTVEKWRCDRCGIVAEKWDRPIPYIEVTICQDYDVGPGPRIIWKEMCVECTVTVAREFSTMQESAKAARRLVKETTNENH